jgi:hypothetical protein
MRILKAFAASLIILMFICSYDFGQAASPADTSNTSPVITAKVNGVPLEIAAPNHVTLPATIVFTADKPVTIYYSTNGGDPATSAAYAIISSANGTSVGPTIDTTDFMLLTLGRDATESLTPLMTYTFVTP